MDQSELEIRHFRGVWSVTGRGVSAVAQDRATALREWAKQAQVDLNEPIQHPDGVREPVGVAMSDPSFWARFLH